MKRRFCHSYPSPPSTPKCTLFLFISLSLSLSLASDAPLTFSQAHLHQFHTSNALLRQCGRQEEDEEVNWWASADKASLTSKPGSDIVLQPRDRRDAEGRRFVCRQSKQNEQTHDVNQVSQFINVQKALVKSCLTSSAYHLLPPSFASFSFIPPKMSHATRAINPITQ